MTSGAEDSAGAWSPPPLCGAVLAPSPNHGPRRDGARPELIVLHYTHMPNAAAALARLRDPAAEVSAHYLIGADGALWALVPEAARAWHAGASFWAGAGDVNSRSIGVELDHPGHDPAGGCPPFPEKQMRALEALLGALTARWAIRPEGVLAHSDVAPGRKIDPGEKFDWARLARSGLARAAPVVAAASVMAANVMAASIMAAEASPARGGADPARFEAALRRIGYGDEAPEALLDAFRRRWRPAALGRALEAADLALAEALAAA